MFDRIKRYQCREPSAHSTTFGSVDKRKDTLFCLQFVGERYTVQKTKGSAGFFLASNTVFWYIFYGGGPHPLSKLAALHLVGEGLIYVNTETIE